MRLIKNGNFSYAVRTIISWIGAGVIYIAVFHIQNKTLQWLVGSIGLVIGALGMYSAQAAMLKLKPFTRDPLSWRGAKQSYKTEVEEKNLAPVLNEMGEIAKGSTLADQAVNKINTPSK